jgi:cellulose synthase/poly-beta-1,6-N-acetylglucosamine synthase-like glycosyltransferase
MSVSVLITSYNEPDTVGNAIQACLAQLPADGEVLVICPDEATRAVVLGYANRDGRVRHLHDERKGKPAALNVGLAQARHDVVILTDGDVYAADDAFAFLLAPFADAEVGAVTARPISLSPRETMLGFWSHLLTDGAHATRQARAEKAAFLLCSGYLFAYRKALMPHIPEDALAEDAVISHRIAEQGYRIAYAPQAHVYVKYPTTYSDWLKQKVRSAGGYVQDYITQSPVQMRSAGLEVRDGLGFALRYPRTWRERWHTLWLLLARLHLWLLVYWRVRVRSRSLLQLWQPVKTTK